MKFYLFLFCLFSISATAAGLGNEPLFKSPTAAPHPSAPSSQPFPKPALPSAVPTPKPSSVPTSSPAAPAKPKK